MQLIIKFIMTALIFVLLDALYMNYIASSMIKRTVNAVQGEPITDTTLFGNIGVSFRNYDVILFYHSSQ